MTVKAFVNGLIYSSFNPPKRIEGFIESNGLIIYTGSKKDVIDIARKLNAEIIDLEGKVVIPGFIDSHMHIDGLGLALKSLDLKDTRSIDELKGKLRSFYENNPDMSWIVGRGWDQELFKEGRWPTRWDIDDVVPDKPVLLLRVCGHAALVNSKALEIAGLSTVSNYLSDNLVKDDRGRLTGIVLEDAVEYFRSLVSFTDTELKEMLIDALEYIAYNGITTVGFPSCSIRVFKILEEIRMEGRLPIRVRCYLDKHDIKEVIKLGIRLGFGDDYLKIMGIKLFADGSLGARTAWLSHPYEDDPDTSGYPNMKEDELGKIVEEINRSGLQIAIHAIGDKAIDSVIKIYSKLGDDIKRYRHRIEHLSLVRYDEIRKISVLGIGAVVQPHFIISDWWAIKRIGVERARYLYPLKTLIKAGIKIGFSSDSPVEPLNPWESVYAAVTRGRYENIELSKYTPYESISIEEALHAYTLGSAYILHDEDKLGVIEEGKYADFIVLNRDPLEVIDREINKIKVLATYVDGVEVYHV